MGAISGLSWWPSILTALPHLHSAALRIYRSISGLILLCKNEIKGLCHLTSLAEIVQHVTKVQICVCFRLLGSISATLGIEN